MQNALVPSFRFEEGLLHIVTEQWEMLIDAWPRLEAARKGVNDRGWCPFRPAFPLVMTSRRPKPPSDYGQMILPLEATPTKPPVANQRKVAFDALRATLPEEVAACTERYPWRHWRLLRLYKLEPKALELAHSNPMLVFCLANAGVLGGPSSLMKISVAAKLVRCKQREISRALGFPETNEAARIISKITPESAAAGIIGCLRVVLADSDISKTLSHLPSINAGVMALLADCNVRVCVTPNLLEEVAGAAREKYRGVTASRIAAIHLMLRQLDQPASGRRYNSGAEVAAHHDDLLREFGTHRVLTACKVEFQPPPLPGTDTIVPVRTPWELHEEGQQQHNCVGSYTEPIMAGKLYVYRVLRPQRATLSIGQGFDGNWQIQELLQSHDRPVSEATREHVASWISQFFDTN